MKTLKWFKIGEAIPDQGRYFKSEVFRENPHECEDSYGSYTETWTGWDNVEYHLYEIPLPQDPTVQGSEGE